MKLVFDAGTLVERFLPIDTMNESVSDNRLRASLNKPYEDLENIPDVSVFYSHKDFDTVDVIVGDKTIRLYGKYNYISSLNVTYSDRSKQYSLNVVLECNADKALNESEHEDSLATGDE